MTQNKIRIRSVSYVYDPDATQQWYAILVEEIIRHLKTETLGDVHTDEKGEEDP